LDYIDGANLIANKTIEQIILNGQLFLWIRNLSEKTRKTEWLDFYTLSKSEQQTPGRTAQN
jgi:hypothetical protein